LNLIRLEIDCGKVDIQSFRNSIHFTSGFGIQSTLSDLRFRTSSDIKILKTTPYGTQLGFEEENYVKSEDV